MIDVEYICINRPFGLHEDRCIYTSGEGNGNPLQYSCLRNCMDRGSWRATVYRVAKSWTWLSNWTTIHLSPCKCKHLLHSVLPTSWFIDELWEELGNTLLPKNVCVRACTHFFLERSLAFTRFSKNLGLKNGKNCLRIFYDFVMCAFIRAS